MLCIINTVNIIVKSLNVNAKSKYLKCVEILFTATQ